MIRPTTAANAVRLIEVPDGGVCADGDRLAWIALAIDSWIVSIHNDPWLCVGFPRENKPMVAEPCSQYELASLPELPIHE